MSICKRITRSLGTLIILWSAAACAGQSLEITGVSGASDAGASSNEGAAVSTTETGPASREATTDPGVRTAPVSGPSAAVGSDALAKGPSESIEVHGHWVIEVRDPDGSLVSRHEFENALVQTEVLVGVLARTNTTGGWGIVIDSPCLDGGSLAQCTIEESSSTIPAAPTIFKNLTVTVVGSTIKLSGTVTAQGANPLLAVGTFNRICGSSITPDACPGVSPAPLPFVVTGTSITPQEVLTGQSIQVSVVLSFL